MYCSAGTTVQGCESAISSAGLPGQRNGLVFYGLSPRATPWTPSSSSSRCVADPVRRTTQLFSGGTAGACDGSLRLELNGWLRAHPAALGQPLGAGQTLYAQGWFRDPGAPRDTNLSDALSFTLRN